MFIVDRYGYSYFIRGPVQDFLITGAWSEQLHHARMAATAATGCLHWGDTPVLTW
jgi:hypothetical protein